MNLQAPRQSTRHHFLASQRHLAGYAGEEALELLAARGQQASRAVPDTLSGQLTCLCSADRAVLLSLTPVSSLQAKTARQPQIQVTHEPGCDSAPPPPAGTSRQALGRRPEQAAPWNQTKGPDGHFPKRTGCVKRLSPTPAQGLHFGPDQPQNPTCLSPADSQIWNTYKRSTTSEHERSAPHPTPSQQDDFSFWDSFLANHIHPPQASHWSLCTVSLLYHYSALGRVRSHPGAPLAPKNRLPKNTLNSGSKRCLHIIYKRDPQRGPTTLRAGPSFPPPTLCSCPVTRLSPPSEAAPPAHTTLSRRDQ